MKQFFDFFSSFQYIQQSMKNVFIIQGNFKAQKKSMDKFQSYEDVFNLRKLMRKEFCET